MDVARTQLSKEIAKFEDKKRAKEINDKFKESLKFAQTELGIKDPKVGTILQYGPISIQIRVQQKSYSIYVLMVYELIAS